MGSSLKEGLKYALMWLDMLGGAGWGLLSSVEKYKIKRLLFVYGDFLEKNMILVIVVVAAVAGAGIWFVFLNDPDPIITDPDANNPPTVTITVEDANGDDIVLLHEQLSLNATALDADGDALSYTWDFDSLDGIQNDAGGASVTHSYQTIGVKEVTLNVSDGTDNTETTLIITVEAGDPPSAILGVQERETGDLISLHAGYTVTVTSITKSVPTDQVRFYIIDSTTNATIKKGLTSDIDSVSADPTIVFLDTSGQGNLTANDIYQINDLNYLQLGIQPGDKMFLVWDILDSDNTDDNFPEIAIIGEVIFS